MKRLALASLLLLVSTAAAENVARSKKLYDEGMGAASASNMALAAQLFQESLAANPKNFLAAFDLAGAFGAKGEKDNAITWYQRTLDLKPDFAEAQSQLATLYLLHRRDNDKAIQTYRAAILQLGQKPHVDPRFRPPHTRGQSLLNAAVAYAQKGQYGVALGIGHSFLKDPAVDHDLDGKVTALIGRAEKSIQPATQRPLGAELDGVRKVLRGEHPDDALQQFLAFERAHPTSKLTAAEQWDLFEGQGMVHAMAKRPDGAIKYFGKARDAAEHLPYAQLLESTFNLATALADAERADEALQQIEALLWLESLTQHDPSPGGQLRLHDKIQHDSAFAKLRAGTKLAPLLARYGFAP